MKDKEKIFENGYSAYSEAIFRYCYFRVFNRERAKEITQEVFMKTWEYMAKGNEIENFQAFVYKIAHNLSVNEISRKKKHDSLDNLRETIGFDVPDDRLSGKTIEEASEVRLAVETIQKLDPDTRDILLMRHVDGLSLEEIGSALGLQKNTVAVRLHRALEKMKELYT